LNLFERLVWQQNPDRIILDDLIFDLGRLRESRVGDGDDSFIFLKERRMLDQYAALWGACPPPAGGHMLELGIYDGGSIAFWCELLQPARCAAVDIMPWGSTPYFDRFITSRGLGDRVTCHWGTDQADAAKLRSIVADDLQGQLDLVIDDASHQYIPTKASFETLFPLIRPGGLYVIEDWSWGCWPNLPADFELAKGSEPDRLIGEIAVAAGRMDGFIIGKGPCHTLAPLINRVTIMSDIAVVERGSADAAKVPGFTLENYTTRRK
jgi:hypothetical protein